MATTPIWIRLGYRTQYQYRSAKARRQVNPLTGKNYTSERQRRDVAAKLRGKPRDYAAERARADAHAKKLGFHDRLILSRVRRALKTWRLDIGQLQALRRLNVAHWREVRHFGRNTEFPVGLHRYQEPRQGDADRLVGYIVSYFHTFVDPEHNWYSVLDSDGTWRMTDGYIPGDTRPILVPVSDDWWRLYFVEYAQIYSRDAYDTRYGYSVLGNSL